MNSIRQNLFDVYNHLNLLDPNRLVTAHKDVQVEAFNHMRQTLMAMHAQVDTAEEIIALLGIKKEVSK